MKRVLSAALAAMVSVTMASSALAAQWQPAITPNGTNVMFNDSNESQYSHSWFYIVRKNKDGGGNASSGCLTFGSGPCDPAIHKDFEFTALQVFPMCKEADQEMCIEQVNIYKDGSAPTQGKFVGELAGNSWPANAKYNLPASSPGLVFESSDVTSPSGATKYVVSATANLNFNFKTSKFEMFKFSMGVSPFTTATENQSATEFRQIAPGTPLTGPVANPGNYLDGEVQLARRDLSPEAGKKLVYEDFDPETRVGLKLRLPSEAFGWFSGRVNDPTFNLQPISKTANRLSIDAKALNTHRLSAFVPSGTVTPSMRFLGIKNDGGNGGIGIETGSALNWMSELRTFAKDKDSGSTTDWNIRMSPAVGNCFPKNTFSGLASSNAVAFSWDPPVYQNGFLDYKVAGMHYASDGQVAKGTYDLVIRASILRCLYNLPNVPISATLSVVDTASGDVEYAVATVSQSGDWLKLRATNFTFSNKTMRLKITPTIKLKSLTCVSTKNPKLTKVVTGTNPKCPTGYKVKG